ncbi:hypothetical protein BDZ97DRAFT_2078687 [Flammula alnicola]|nr:hypothetical protein BDZ97DRAFT_2078687 [Flammula alnicola]
MTSALCTAFCSGINFPLPAKLCEHGVYFRVLLRLQRPRHRHLAPRRRLQLPCGGDDTLACGNAGAISVFQNLNEGMRPVPTNKAQMLRWGHGRLMGVSPFNFDSDTIDGNGRTLLERFDVATGVTIESSMAQCEATGFNIIGLEFGQECWCGSSFLVANTTAPFTACSRACEADHTELRGASTMLSFYLNEPVVVSPPQPTTTVVVVPTTTVVIPPPTTVAPQAPPTTVALTTVELTTVVPTTVVPTSIVPTTVVPTTVKSADYDGGAYYH